MTAGQNIETVRQMYQAFGSGDVQAILDRVTDDVDWSTDAAIVSVPWYGPRHGKDGVGRHGILDRRRSWDRSWSAAVA